MGTGEGGGRGWQNRRGREEGRGGGGGGGFVTGETATAISGSYGSGGVGGREGGTSLSGGCDCHIRKLRHEWHRRVGEGA